MHAYQRDWCVWTRAIYQRRQSRPEMKIATRLTVGLSEWPCNNTVECIRARYLGEDARRLQKPQVPNAHHLLHADNVNPSCSLSVRLDSAWNCQIRCFGKRYRHTCSWFETNEFECLVALCTATVGSSSVSFELPPLQSSRTLMSAAAAAAHLLTAGDDARVGYASCLRHTTSCAKDAIYTCVMLRRRERFNTSNEWMNEWCFY